MVSERRCKDVFTSSSKPGEQFSLNMNTCSLQRSLEALLIQYRYYKPADAFNAATRSRASQVNSGSSRPKWP